MSPRELESSNTGWDTVECTVDPGPTCVHSCVGVTEQKNEKFVLPANSRHGVRLREKSQTTFPSLE